MSLPGSSLGKLKLPAFFDISKPVPLSKLPYSGAFREADWLVRSPNHQKALVVISVWNIRKGVFQGRRIPSGQGSVMVPLSYQVWFSDGKGNLIHPILMDEEEVGDTVFSQDNRYFVTYSSQATRRGFQLWDARTGKALRFISDDRWKNMSSYDVQFSRDGTRLYTALSVQDGVSKIFRHIVVVWDVASGRVVRVITPEGKEVLYDLIFSVSSDDSTLALARVGQRISKIGAVSYDSNVQLWRVR